MATPAAAPTAGANPYGLLPALEQGGIIAWSVFIILVGMSRGEHKVLIEVVDPEGKVLTAQTMTFKSPGK